MFKYETEEERKEAIRRAQYKYIMNTNYYCEVCDINVKMNYVTHHKRSANHRRLAGVSDSCLKWYCDVCDKDYALNYKSKHQKNKKHIKNCETNRKNKILLII